MNLQALVQLVNHIQKGLFVNVWHHYYLLKVRVKVRLLYISRYNRVQGVPKLVGYAGVYQRQKLVFRFELGELVLSLVLSQQKVIADVHYLDYFLDLLTVEVAVDLDLKVFF